MADIPRPEDYGGKRSDMYQGYRGAEVSEVNRYSKRLIGAESFPDTKSAKAYVKALKAAGMTGPGTDYIHRITSYDTLRVY